MPIVRVKSKEALLNHPNFIKEESYIIMKDSGILVLTRTIGNIDKVEENTLEYNLCNYHKIVGTVGYIFLSCVEEYLWTIELKVLKV